MQKAPAGFSVSPALRRSCGAPIAINCIWAEVSDNIAPNIGPKRDKNENGFSAVFDHGRDAKRDGLCAPFVQQFLANG
jgi:hypothetical protein